MTRKQYKAIAEVLKGAKDYADQSKVVEERVFVSATVAGITDNLATVFKLDNPKFDRDKFLTACGF